MTADEIQTAVDALMSDMVSRGLRSPTCYAWFKAYADPQIYLHWDEDGCPHGRTEIGRGDTIAEALENASEILEAIPTKEDRDHAEFTRLLANVIDKGRTIGIDVDFLNPLTEMMTKLSTNIITKQELPF